MVKYKRGKEKKGGFQSGITKGEKIELVLFDERARSITLRPLRISWGTIMGLSLNSEIWIRDDRRLEIEYAGY